MFDFFRKISGIKDLISVLVAAFRKIFSAIGDVRNWFKRREIEKKEEKVQDEIAETEKEEKEVSEQIEESDKKIEDLKDERDNIEVDVDQEKEDLRDYLENQ